MKNLSKDIQAEIAERSAIHMLMEKWVSENASEVAHVFEELVPFICGECNLSELKSALNVVNITFATIALETIRERNNKNNENDFPRCLPADATEMQNSLYNLSQFLKLFEPMGGLIERNENTPAFRMSISTFGKIDSI